MYCFHLFCTKVHRVQNDGETVHHVLSTFDVQKVHKMCERTLDVLVQNKWKVHKMCKRTLDVLVQKMYKVYMMYFGTWIVLVQLMY